MRVATPQDAESPYLNSAGKERRRCLSFDDNDAGSEEGGRSSTMGDSVRVAKNRNLFLFPPGQQPEITQYCPIALKESNHVL